MRLTHYTWRGRSKGAGFHRVEWRTVEIDFTKNRIRIIGRSTRRPAPRLPGPGRSNVFDTEWNDLARDREQKLRLAVAAWLRSEPGQVSQVFCSIGREDGYAEMMNLFTSAGQYTFRVNPKNFCGDRIARTTA